jgi:hypothetical protein
MRLTVTSALFMLCCNSLWAADAEGTDGKWRISILASEISTSSTNEFSNDDPHGGVGIGLAYAPNAKWDVELTASSQTHISPSAVFFRVPPFNGGPEQTYESFEFQKYRVVPIDLTATRHFLTDQVIAPYVRAGFRYVRAPEDKVRQFITIIGPTTVDPTISVPYYPVHLEESGFNFSDRASAEVGAGLRLRLTPRTAIRAEANRLLRSEGADFDPLTRFAVGLSFLF